MNIVIYARLGFGGQAGGIEQFLLTLIHALGGLTDGPERYQIITDSPAPEPLAACLGPNQKLVMAPEPVAPEPVAAPKRTLVGRLRDRVCGASGGTGGTGGTGAVADERILPEDDGWIASLDPHVVHFPYQWLVRCRAPMIFNPHDLQHKHYPEFFDDEQLRTRERIYTEACAAASVVIAESNWGRDDLIDQYQLASDKVLTILRGSPTEAYDALDQRAVTAVREELGLPDMFAFFPAQTWPHKNHLKLLEALAILRDRDQVTLPLICTGRQNDHYEVIQGRIQELGLSTQVRFLGFVTPAQLRAIYACCGFVVFPSLFEGGGFPIQEAFLENAPVACSNVTSLPGYAGDAALLFDPSRPDAMADALKRMATDAGLRDRLRAMGSERIKQFRWSQTAKAYRALYRKLGGRRLTDEDRGALDSQGLCPQPV